MANVWDHFETTISRDLIDLCTEKYLGSGMSRETYVFGPYPSLVIKFETGRGCFQNVLEWEVWERVERTKSAKWFAPCVRISDNGKVLLMKRTDVLGWKERPAKMPTFFTDLKIENFGTIDGKVVAHDYGVNLMLEKGMKSVLAKANWWKE